MVCKKCGKPLPNEGAVCKFCGVMMEKGQIKRQQEYKSNSFTPTLLSDRYNVDKKSIYEKKEPDFKENKFLGMVVILGVLLFLIILVIIVNVGK